MNNQEEQSLVYAEWEKANKELTKDMSDWRDQYKCRGNCLEWRKWKYCKHLVKARVKYFRVRIEESINNLYFMNYGINMNDASEDQSEKEKGK